LQIIESRERERERERERDEVTEDAKGEDGRKERRMPFHLECLGEARPQYCIRRSNCRARLSRDSRAEEEDGNALPGGVDQLV